MNSFERGLHQSIPFQEAADFFLKLKYGASPEAKFAERDAALLRDRLKQANAMMGGLGASPGASTAVPAMLDVLERCFPDRYQGWLPKLKELVPTLGTELSKEPKLFEEIWAWGSKALKLDQAPTALPASV